MTAPAVVPPRPRLPAVLDRFAGSPYGAEPRTGGTAAAAFPDERSLAGRLAACRVRDLPLELTAGLPDAVRDSDPATALEHHGSRDVVPAVAAGRGGRSVDDLTRLRAERDREAVRTDAARLASDQVDGVRRSVGPGRVEEPGADLVSLRFVAHEDTR